MAKPRWCFNLTIDNRPGDSLHGAAERLARRLASIGFVGCVMNGAPEGSDPDGVDGKNLWFHFGDRKEATPDADR